MNWTGLLTVLLASTQSPSTLEDVSWNLTALSGQRVTVSSGRPAPKLLLTAADQRVSGNLGCNDVSGTFEHDGTSLRFVTLDVTKRVCDDPVLNQREKLLLKALRDTRSWQSKNNTLTLTGPGVKWRASCTNLPRPSNGS